MKTTTPELRALWATRSFDAYNLFTITCVDGTILRYTSTDHNVTYNGNTFLCGGVSGPFFERSADSGGDSVTCNWQTGMEASTLTVDVLPGTGTINGVPFLRACINGVLDGATFKRERVYMPKGVFVATGGIILDLGRITEISAGRSYLTISVADFRELLNINMPLKVYQPGCINSLYDTNCGLSKATFTSTGAATSGSTASTVHTGLSQADGYFDLGVITFTSGANAGVSRSVKSYAGGTINVIAPFPSAPAVADTFSVYRGCDKTYAGGCTALGNTARFRGFPDLPAPTTIL